MFHNYLAQGRDEFEILSVPGKLTVYQVFAATVVSYQRFEDQTPAHRLGSASATRQWLTRILHASRYLSLRRRLELYMASVRSAATYGLAAVGMTRKGVQHLNA